MKDLLNVIMLIAMILFAILIGYACFYSDKPFGVLFLPWVFLAFLLGYKIDKDYENS